MLLVSASKDGPRRSFSTGSSSWRWKRCSGTVCEMPSAWLSKVSWKRRKREIWVIILGCHVLAQNGRDSELIWAFSARMTAGKRRRHDGEARPASSVVRSLDLIRLVTSYQHGLGVDGHDLLLAIQWSAVKASGLSYVFPAMSAFPFVRLVPWVDRHGLDRLNDVLTFVEARSSSHLLSHIVYCVAVRYGHLPLLRGVGGPRCHRRTGLDFNMAMDVAAKHGHLDIVQWLHANRKEGCTSAALDNAARNGHVDVVDWLHHAGVATFSSQLPDIMTQAVSNKDLRMVEWLHRHRTRQWPRGLLDSIAADGNVGMMAFFHQHSTEQCTTNAMDIAASRGHLDMVQFLHFHRREGCTTQAIDLAAGNGHFVVVKWLLHHRHESYTWNAIYLAACGGHMHVLQYLARVGHLQAAHWRCAQVAAQTRGRLDAVAVLAQVSMSAKHKKSQPHKFRKF